MRVRLLAAYLLILSGCGEEPPRPKVVEKVLYVNQFEQAVDTIPYGEWAKWLEEHKDRKIVALTSVCNNPYDQNPTTHIIVVYDYYSEAGVKK